MPASNCLLFVSKGVARGFFRGASFSHILCGILAIINNFHWLNTQNCFDPIYFLFQTPKQGADNSIYAALSPELEGVGGRYFVNCQSTQSSDESYREDVQKRLWKVSCELTGIPE